MLKIDEWFHPDGFPISVERRDPQEHFEPLLKNLLMPANALRLIARGLSNAVARGEAPPPTPADIRAALQADIEEAEVAELMRLLGRGL